MRRARNDRRKKSRRDIEAGAVRAVKEDMKIPNIHYRRQWVKQEKLKAQRLKQMTANQPALGPHGANPDTFRRESQPSEIIQLAGKVVVARWRSLSDILLFSVYVIRD